MSLTLHDVVREHKESNGSKIVLLVADGLGGLPITPGGPTELEAAKTPNLDQLATEGTVGLSTPVAPGITPGSGPGHLGLFGFDPLDYVIGRGVLEALGVDVEVGPRDVAIRGNFCTIDSHGNITDRRAGRIPTATCRDLVEKLKGSVKVSGVETLIKTVQDYRFVVRFTGDGLGDQVNDTDPGNTGAPPLDPVASDPGSERTAAVAKEFLRQAREVLKDERPANFMTLRGFANFPRIETMESLYGLRSAAIAVYPMYRGLARLVGMTIADAGQTLSDQMDALHKHWESFDFFFVHFKYTDSTGEDGKFDEKVKRIEELDAVMPRIVDLKPDVLIVTGDHSTPSKMRSHSFHPVPLLMWAPATGRPDLVTSFGERPCAQGGLGQILAKHIMPLAMAHAKRLSKFGA